MLIPRPTFYNRTIITGKIMTSTGGGSIGEVLLKKDSTTGIEFEAVFTTVLVTILLATLPRGETRLIISSVVFLLLAILVVRWLAVNGRFANKELGLGYTYRSLELLSIVAVFHIIYFGVEWIAVQLHWTLYQPTSTIAGIFIIALLVIIGIEFLQRTYRLWWGTVFYVKARSLKSEREGERGILRYVLNFLLTNIVAQIAYYLLENSIPEGDHSELNELREFVSNVEDTLDEEGETVHPFRIMMLSGLIVVPTYIVIAWILSLLLGPIRDIFVVLVGVWVLQHLISFLYITNGASSIATWNQPNLRSIGTKLLFTGVVYWIFFA